MAVAAVKATVLSSVSLAPTAIAVGQTRNTNVGLLGRMPFLVIGRTVDPSVGRSQTL